MPIYSHKCEKCGETVEGLLPYERRHDGGGECCGEPRKLVFTTNNERENTMVMETVDKYTGKKVQRGIQKIMRKRHEKHKQEVEVGEFIEQHGYAEAVKRGYVKKDGSRCL